MDPPRPVGDVAFSFTLAGVVAVLLLALLLLLSGCGGWSPACVYDGLEGPPASQDKPCNPTH